MIILGVDSSLSGWGAILMQMIDSKRHPSRYESGVWSPAEQKYDATKHECRGVLKAFKKFRHYLYGTYFVLETDARVLVSQLNQSGTDLPGALLTRWLAWIRLFDFEVKHVPGRKHTAADGLSRRPAAAHEVEDLEDIDDFIAAELNSIRINPMALDTSISPLHEGYSEKSVQIAFYLTTFQKPTGMTLKEFNQFKKKALRYKVQDRHLFRRNSKNVPLRRVIDRQADKDRILQHLHDESGHRGQEGTYRRIADRYWWDNLYADVKTYLRTCPECQKRDPTRIEEVLHPTYVSFLFQKVGLDVVYMPPCMGFNFIVLARCDLSGWVEGRALRKADSPAVAKFMWEDIICRHGCFGRLVIDGGRENLGVAEALAARYGIKRVVTSAYHPQANGMVERGHRPIVDALSKMPGKWVENLHAVLWADRSTTHNPTGMTPFRMVCGSEPVLPIELDIPTWRILPWDQVHSTADLIEMRARQLQRRDEDMEEATLLLQRMRMQGKDLFDDSHRIREEPLAVDDLVLLYDSQREANMSIKLAFKWLGPYRIAEVVPEKGTYFLKELNGTRLKGTIAGNRLKRFHSRQRLDELEDLSDSELEENDDPEDPTVEVGSLAAEISSFPSAAFYSRSFMELGRTFLRHD